MKSACNDLAQAIINGQAVLFLGQAYLTWTEIESLDHLVDPVLQNLRFDISKSKKLEGLFKVCCELLEPPSRVSQEKLMECLHEVSRQIKVEKKLELVSQVPWKAVMTSAVDEVFGRALDVGQDYKTVRHIYDDNQRLTTISNSEMMYVVHLRGCVDQIDPHRTPAVSPKEEVARRRVINRLVSRLLDFVGLDTRVVIAGFDPSTESASITRNLCNVLMDLPENSCYWLKGDEKPVSDTCLQLLINDCIMNVVTEDLPDYLEGLGQAVFNTETGDGERVVLTPQGRVTFTKAAWRQFRKSMIIMDQAILQREKQYDFTEQRYEHFYSFLRGNSIDWPAYAAELPFKRKALTDIAESTLKKLQDGNATRNSVIIVSGPSGSGKTVILEQLAWDFANQNFPVVYLPKNPHDPQFRLIEAFCQEIQPKDSSKQTQPQAQRNCRVLDTMGFIYG